MMRVKVLYPFNSKATGKYHEVGDIIEVTDEQLAAIREVSVNFVVVLDEEEKPKEKPKAKPKQKKAKAKTE